MAFVDVLGNNQTYGNYWNIRIYHECEDEIEKSVPRITNWLHEAYRVMTNGDREGMIFLSYPHTNNGFFILHTTILEKHEKASRKSCIR